MHAIVTGAAGGIGSAVVAQLVELDVRVYAWDVSRAALNRLRDAHGPLVQPRCVDVASAASVGDAAMEVASTEGAPDYLVCAAGINPLTESTEAIDDAFYNSVMSVNLTGCFNACRCVLPGMARRGRGSVVNVASVSGLLGWGGSSAYSASKGGMIAFTRALAIEYAPQSVRVNAVCPGSVRTEMVLGNLRARGDVEPGLARIAAKHPMGRMGEPSEVASVVTFLLGKGASFVTGTAVPIDGGLSAW